MKTYVELYDFLKNYDGDIISWLEENWKGKEKQESLFRILSYLGVMDLINNYNICKGNYNLQTIKKIENINEIFYNDKGDPINLKDNGDASDLTFLNKNDKKSILVTTSKNFKKENIGKLDIEKILAHFAKYKESGFKLNLCIVVRDKQKLLKNIPKLKDTNKLLKDTILDDKTIIIDWNDLKNGYDIFKKTYGKIKLKNLLLKNKYPIVLKLHQKYSVLKMQELKNQGEKNILFGHIPRSGKSYCLCGSIICDSENKNECNYLIITTAPKETIEQYIKIFNCLQLSKFNIINLNSKSKIKLQNKNIIICSKQYLQNKNIKWLKELSIDIRYIDESHNGGTTELSKKMLDKYGKNSTTVFMSATYTKPVFTFNIKKNNMILWTLEDIKLCCNIDQIENLNKLKRKFGEIFINLLNEYSIENIKKEYSKYPDLYLLTHKINNDIVQDIKKNTVNNNYGWSLESVFSLINDGKIKKPRFQNEKQVLNLFYNIFGKYNKFNILDENYSEDEIMIKRIENICKNPNINSRFFDINEPIIMAFLPQDNINLLSETLQTLLKKYKVIEDYELVIINSQITNDPKKKIIDGQIKAKHNNKKGVLVLSGRQCSLGVSLKYCDIVLLLNNTQSSDLIYQMMFRSMTESQNKKCGFVVDFNIHRVIEKVLMTSASFIKPNKHPKKAVKYLITQKLINLNIDHWMLNKSNYENNLEKMVNRIYDIYSLNTEKVLNTFLDRLKIKKTILDNNDRKMLSVMFKSIKPTKKQKKIIEKIVDNSKDNIKKGVEKEKIDCLKKDDSDDNIDDFNFMELLKHIIPLICLLTIHNKNTSFIEMFEFIKQNKYVYDILMDQTKTWWGNEIDKNMIEQFLIIYEKYLKNDKETNIIVRTIKELFIKNITNQKELSKIIDKYLIPQELEKKMNAEVSTPYKLRQEMLDKIPINFWKNKNKVFEPCSGKGGFLIDIIDRFMKNLPIKDNKTKYKFIVEELLYFCDINPTNIFINKLLLDPYDEYKLNYHEGNTLELDIKKKWNIEGFDAVIGNPPYNASGNTNTGHTIWQHFVDKGLNKWLIKNAYLLYVHPAGWRKPSSYIINKIKLSDLMKKHNDMIYLEIHNTKDGQKTFNCGTRYDWYLIKKENKNSETLIKDELGLTYKINIKNLNFIPNFKIKQYSNIIGNYVNALNRCFEHSSTKKYVKKNKSNEYKYELIHSTTKKGIRYLYTNRNDIGYFGIKKIIFGDSGINDVIIDDMGYYGASEHAICLKYENLKEANTMKNILLSDNFKDFIKSCSWSNYQIDWKLFNNLKKDFWKEFE